MLELTPSDPADLTPDGATGAGGEDVEGEPADGIPPSAHENSIDTLDDEGSTLTLVSMRWPATAARRSVALAFCRT